MATKESPTTESAFGVLRQFARRPRAVERCELCSIEIAADHPHLIEPVARKLVCSCDACALLFSGRADARFKRVPRQIKLLANFHLSDAQWDSLMIPINMAFFFRSSPDARVVAMYPSPAGATESLLSLEAWSEIARANPGNRKDDAGRRSAAGQSHRAFPWIYRSRVLRACLSTNASNWSA